MLLPLLQYVLTLSSLPWGAAAMASVLRQVPTDAAWDLLPDFTDDTLLCGEDDRPHRPLCLPGGSVNLTAFVAVRHCGRSVCMQNLAWTRLEQASY